MASFGSLITIFQVVLISFFIAPRSPCYADTNEFRGSACSRPSAAAQSPSWTSNLNATFTSLEQNVIPNNGYYKAEVGASGFDKVYGLIQCRGDVSASDCRNCTRESFRPGPENCGGSRSVTIWQKWCFLRYSNESFYGQWQRNRNAIISNDSIPDDPSVATKGLTMMTGLAKAASEEKLMFATSEIDDGNGGKRYGLAQCSRDLGKSDCESCLAYLLNGTDTTVGRRSWDIYGVGCFMLYDHSQFYFNGNFSIYLILILLL